MKKYIFGVDLGGTTVKNGLFTTDGELVYKWEIPTRTEDGGKHVLPDIAASCRKTAIEQGLVLEDFIGLGIGVPGAVRKGGCVDQCVNLGWGYTEVKKEMEALTGLRTEVGNDANVAALGEMWQGAGKGQTDMVMVTLGTGLGGGVIANGKLIVGAHGYGAEIGHMRINMHEKKVRCNCGKMGCFEQYCSATGLANEAKKGLKHFEGQTILRDVANITAKDVFDAVKAGDELAFHVAEQFGKRMAKGLSMIANVTDPAVFVIGGGVSKAGPILLDLIERYYGDFVYGSQNDVEFVIASLGNDAGIYGAAKLLL